jgi:zinc protease
MTTARLPGVLVFPSRDLPLVSVSVCRRVGASVDPRGKEGLGRFMARLMRRTGGGLPADVLDERIDALGGSMGVDGNQSVLSFHGAVISRSIERFGDVLADVLGRPGLTKEEHERLRRETQAEIVEGRDNDRGIARRWFRKKLFDVHPYNRAVGGTIASIGAIEEGDVREHYAATLSPDNLLFSIAGDVTEEKAHELVLKSIEALPDTPRVAEDVPEPTIPSGRRLVFVDKPERTQTQILIGGLGTHPYDEDHIPLLVANTVFGGTFTARLSHEVRSVRGWSYGAYSSLPYDRRRRSFSMWTFPKAEDAAPCIALELDLLERFVSDGITRKELDVAKRYLSRSHAFAVDTATKRASLAADEVLYDLPPGYHETHVDRIRGVTLEEANAAVALRLAPENLLIVVVGTDADVGGAVRDAIPRLATSEVVPFDGDV